MHIRQSHSELACPNLLKSMVHKSRIILTDLTNVGSEKSDVVILNAECSIDDEENQGLFKERTLNEELHDIFKVANIKVESFSKRKSNIHKIHEDEIKVRGSQSSSELRIYCNRYQRG